MRKLEHQRVWDDNERRAAVALLIANAGNASLTAQQTGIPRTTLLRWRVMHETADAAVIPRPESTQIDHAGEWSEIQQLARQRIRELIPATEDVRALGIVAGIAADKHLDYTQGRRGHTVNVDARSVQLGAGLSDDERRALLVSAIGQAAVAALPPDHDDGSAATDAFERD